MRHLPPSPGLAAVCARFVADPSPFRARAVVMGLSACLRASGFRPERLAVPSVGVDGLVICTVPGGSVILIAADGSAIMPGAPDPRIAAVAIAAVADDYHQRGVEHSEPYRAAACALGWEDLDGSPWWDLVMDLIG